MEICRVSLKHKLKKMICIILGIAMISSTVSVEYAGIYANAAESAAIAPLSIAQGLGSARYFGILANNLENNAAANFESNIAVNNITGNFGEIGNAHSWSNNASSTIRTVTLSINAPKGTYHFGIYKNVEGTQLQGNTFWIESDGSRSVCKTISGLTPNQTYYAYLIQNDKANTKVGSTLRATAYSDSDQYAYANYIGNVNYDRNTTIKVKKAANISSRVYFGGSCALWGYGSNQGNVINEDSGNWYLVDQLSSVTTTQKEAFPVDLGTKENQFAKGTYDNLQKLSTTLSNTPNSGTDAAVKVINLALQPDHTGRIPDWQIRKVLCEYLGCTNCNQDGTNTNYLKNTGIPLSEEQYLVINLQINGMCKSINLPKVRIGNQDPDNNYNPIARKVLWNFATTSSNLQINASEGSGVGMIGTVLAPSSKVTLQSCMLTGAVYANTVTIANGGGLKCATFQVGSTGESTLLVPAPSANVTLTKAAKMLDGRTAQISLTRSGVMNTYTSIPDSEVIMMMDRSISMKLSVDGTKHDENSLDPYNQDSNNYKLFATDSRLALLQSAAKNFLGKLTATNKQLPTNKQINVAAGCFCWSKKAVGNRYFSYLKDDPMNTIDYNVVHDTSGRPNWHYYYYTPQNKTFEGTFINDYGTPSAATNQISSFYPAPYTCLDAAIDTVSSKINEHTNNQKKKYIIFISDGEPNGPNINGKDSVEEAKQYLKNAGISTRSDTVIYSAFIGNSERGESVMKALATSPENYLKVTDSEGLSNVFKKIEEGILSYTFDNNAVLTDTLPNYLMLTDAQEKAIIDEYPGSTVTVNKDATTTIGWNALSLDAAVQNITFEATARDDYFASPHNQKVPTNTAAKLTYYDPITKTAKSVSAESPLVKIHGTANVTGGVRTIQRGDKVDLLTLNKFSNTDKMKYGTSDCAEFVAAPSSLAGFTWQILDTDKKTVLATSVDGSHWSIVQGKTTTVSPRQNTTYFLRVFNSSLYKDASGKVVEKNFDETKPLDIFVPCSGSITIKKKLQDEKGSTLKEFTVQVRSKQNGYSVDLSLISGNSNGLKLTNLQPGTYTIHEVVPQNYQFVSMECASLSDSVTSTYQVVISTTNADHSVTITNKYQPFSYFNGGDSKTNVFKTDSEFIKPH